MEPYLSVAHERGIVPFCDKSRQAKRFSLLRGRDSARVPDAHVKAHLEEAERGIYPHFRPISFSSRGARVVSREGTGSAVSWAVSWAAGRTWDLS